MFSDEHRRTMIDHDKTIESYKKNLALHKEEKRRCMEEYDKLSQWTQDQLIEREKQMQAIREQMDQATSSQNTSQKVAKEVRISERELERKLSFYFAVGNCKVL